MNVTGTKLVRASTLQTGMIIIDRYGCWTSGPLTKVEIHGEVVFVESPNCQMEYGTTHKVRVQS